MTFPNSGTQFTSANFIPALSVTNASVLSNTVSLTIVNKYVAGTITAGGSHVRLTFAGNNTAKTSIAACYIGSAATTGNAYNFAGDQVQVTFNSGLSTASIPAGSGNTVRSDTISFALNTGNAICVAFNFASTAESAAYASGLGTKYVKYTHLNNEAASTLKSSSYTANSGQSELVSLIEVY